MIIGIDGNEANVRERVGVSVYTYKHLEYFQKSANKNLRFIVYLKHPPLNDLPDETTFFSYSVIRGSFLWSQISLPFELVKNRFSGTKIGVFFSPAHYTPRITLCPTVVTIHDLAYLHYPDEFVRKDLFQLKHWTRDSIRNAHRIIAVSKTTKKDILKYYNVKDEQVQVVYNGFEKELKEHNKQFSLSHIDKAISTPFILYVGTIQPRKNIITLIRAFAQFYKAYPEFKLVITGKKGWLFDQIFKEARDLYLENKIIFTGYVDDDELITLYKKAFVFVLPSLYEGFGIPVLEAMSFNCPVISSFSSSLPEIGGEAALYFDPEDPQDLANKLAQLQTDSTLRYSLMNKGKKRIKDFSWDICTQKTLEILTSAFNETRK